MYAMVFVGSGRVAGSLLSGYLAQISLALTFTLAATLCLIATLLFYFAFHDGGHKSETRDQKPESTPIDESSNSSLGLPP